MTRVEEIRGFGELTEEDLLFLARGAKALRTGETPDVILLAIASGRGHLLRIVGKARGIITGTIYNYPSGKEFVMGIFAGKGVFPTEYSSLAEALFEWARLKGCQRIKFENIHPALDRLYCRKFDRKATVFVKEI